MDKLTLNSVELHSSRLLKHNKGVFSELIARQRGGLMVEAIVSVSLMAIVGTAVLSGLSMSHISGAHTERQSVGENAARNQMAAVFSAPYVANGGTYSAVTVPAGYAITAETAELDPLNFDPNVQKVTVTVSFNGAEVFQLESININ